MAKKFTEEEKKAVLGRVSEIGVKEAAKEAGVSYQTVYKWNKEAATDQAREIYAKAETEASETVADAITVANTKMAKAEAEAQAVIDQANAENAEAVKEAVEEKKEEIKDKADAAKIETKKKTRSASRKVKEKTRDTKEKVKVAVEKPVKKVKAAKVDMIFETNSGRKITPEAIAEMVPKGADAAYIKLEENKIYWVKGEETGAIDIWE